MGDSRRWEGSGPSCVSSVGSGEEGLLERAQAIGVDIGGTKIAAMRVSGDGSILDRSLVHTPVVDAEELLASAVKMTLSLVTDEVLAVGVGSTGMIDFADGSLRYTPNLPFRDVPIRDRIEAETALPCLV